MRTNIEIDDALMADAMAALGTKTKRETVEAALQRIIKAQRQLQAFKEMKGIGWAGSIDHPEPIEPQPGRG